MTEPNMATMLCYILTDLSVERNLLQTMLTQAVTASFNAISVDGDQRTSDTCFLVSSKAVEPTSPEEFDEFNRALSSICTNLSEDVVRNGEGTNHVIKVKVTNAPTVELARDLGRFIVNSNLVKCAIAGCDPNVGRIVGAIGSYLGKSSSRANGADEIEQKDIQVKLGDIEIFKDGRFLLNPETEAKLSDYLLHCQLYPESIPEHDRTYPTHFRNVDIEVSLGRRHQEASVVFGSDLTKEYVEVNADYRS